MLELRWDGVPSVAPARRMLREQARRTPPPQWVRVVSGWTEFQFAERRMPTLEEINAASPDTPVFVLHLYDRALLNQADRRAAGCNATGWRRGNWPMWRCSPTAAVSRRTRPRATGRE
jgi:predicted amidohydrolase YtcJ